jgi:hypothetical protein
MVVLPLDVSGKKVASGAGEQLHCRKLVTRVMSAKVPHEV